MRTTHVVLRHSIIELLLSNGTVLSTMVQQWCVSAWRLTGLSPRPHAIRRAQNEPSNPSIFGQMLSFEIFTQSESIGSTTYVVKFLYSNSF